MAIYGRIHRMDKADNEYEREAPTSYHVQRARRGDRGSLAWLVERLSPLLLAQASYRLGPRLRRLSEPEDLVAEVWAVAIQRLPALRWERERGTPTLLGFLSTTLLFLVNNATRKALRDEAVLREADMPKHDMVAPLSELPADTSTVISRALRGERIAAVKRAIDELGPDDREILILRGIEQMPNTSVATRLGLKPNTVARRFHRALARLRQRLPDSVFAEIDVSEE